MSRQLVNSSLYTQSEEMMVSGHSPSRHAPPTEGSLAPPTIHSHAHSPCVRLSVHGSGADELHEKRRPFQSCLLTDADRAQHGTDQTQAQLEGVVEHGLALFISWHTLLMQAEGGIKRCNFYREAIVYLCVQVSLLIKQGIGLFARTSICMHMYIHCMQLSV